MWLLDIIKSPFELLGMLIVRSISSLGRAAMLLYEATYLMFLPPYRIRLLFEQLDFIGLKSVPVIVLTGIAIGVVLAIQGYIALSRFGATYVTGGFIAVSMTRELGPVLTGLMVSARASSSMAAQIASMKVTEQIDALQSFAIEPVQYVVVPRIIAGVLVMPVLDTLAILCSIGSGYVFSVYILGVNVYMYQYFNDLMLIFNDYVSGIVKSMCFGFILSFVACYKGYFADNSASGVGKATTEAVVVSAVLILTSDSLLTSLLF